MSVTAPVIDGLGDGETRTSEAAVNPPPNESMRKRLCPQMPLGGWRGWFGPILMMLLAAGLRLPNLGQPRAVVFDETYYMKDGLSLLLFGYERQTVEGADKSILDSSGDPSSLLSLFKDEPSFVVHPPVGKWVIASGESLFGVTPFGWRIGVAVLGILSVLIAARIARRLTRSNLLATLAGLLIAIDGMSIVMSRTALLDTSLMFFVLLAFGCLLLDRDRTRKRLAKRAETTDPATWGAWGPHLGWRPWRIAAGVSLGLACGVKWSGIYYVIGFGLLTVLWDVGARRAIGARKPWRGMLIRDALPAFASIVIVAGATYLGTWVGWFATTGGWDRQWAVGRGTDYPFIPEALRSLWHYHVEALNFHTNLTSPHSYQANAWGWPLQARPTSFFYESPKDVCGTSNCAQEVIALGNPIIWWAGSIALIHQAWRWVGRRDWRSGAVLCAFLAGWLPWLLFQERTVFAFYSIVFEPFVIMALVLTFGALLGKAQAPGNRRMWGTIAVGTIVLAAIAAGWFFFPIWTGDPIPYSDWNLRMWFPTWV